MDSKIDRARHECAKNGPCSINGDGCTCSDAELERRDSKIEPVAWRYLERGEWEYTDGPEQPYPGNGYPVEPLFGGGRRKQKAPDEPADTRDYVREAALLAAEQRGREAGLMQAAQIAREAEKEWSGVASRLKSDNGVFAGMADAAKYCASRAEALAADVTRRNE